MRLDSVRPGDVVLCDRKGRLFYALVERVCDRELHVDPINRGITYYTVNAREVQRHWRLAGRPRPIARRAPRPQHPMPASGEAVAGQLLIGGGR